MPKINLIQSPVSSKSKAGQGIRSMKSYNHLYEKIYDPENLRLAIHRAAKGSKKKRRRDVQYCFSHEDEVVERLHNMLVNETYEFKQHQPRLRYDQNSTNTGRS